MNHSHLKKLLLLACSVVYLHSPAQTRSPESVKPTGDNQQEDNIVPCGNDLQREYIFKNFPELREKILAEEERQEQEIQRRVAALKERRVSAAPVTIPVVVHVVTASGTTIPTAQIQSQIDALNLQFNNTSGGPNNVGTDIHFCLAPRDPQGNLLAEAGITRHPNQPEGDHTDDPGSQAALMAVANYDNSRYLNIWVVDAIRPAGAIAGTVMGYAKFPNNATPGQFDGIVIRSDVFLDNTVNGNNFQPSWPQYQAGKILVHEAGHYLNLYHTFQSTSSCGDPNDATHGDRVDDTPVTTEPARGCNAANSTCSGVQIENHMDYTTDMCRNTFTQGQSNRMMAAIQAFRSGLIESVNLATTGVAGNDPGSCSAPMLIAGYTADIHQVCSTDQITFTALPSSATSWEWKFTSENGTVTSSGVQTTSTYVTTLTTPGFYDVELLISDGSGTSSKIEHDYIFVTQCSPIQSVHGNWYWGCFAGVDFSSGKPVGVSDAYDNQTLQTREGVISISDNNGNLLFYGGSNLDSRYDFYLYNSSHQKINPNTPLKGNGSAVQSSVAFPHPDQVNYPNHYIVVTNANGTSDYVTNPNDGLHYTVVDMNGSGSLLASQVNVPMPPPAGGPQASTGAAQIGEQLIAITNCDGSGYWVIAAGYSGAFRDDFYVYRFDQNGFGGVPDTYGNFTGIDRISWISPFKASPDAKHIGAQLIYSGSSLATTSILDFDNATGVISNPVGFVTNPENKHNPFSFSPSSNLFYAVTTNDVRQYDLTRPNPVSTERIVLDKQVGDLQIGPDNKLYVALKENGPRRIAVFNRPENINSGDYPARNDAGYNDYGPDLVATNLGSGCGSGLDFPNLILQNPNPTQDPRTKFAIINCNTVKFTTELCPGTQVQWDFGDGSTSTQTNPVHTYSTSGNYTVTLLVGPNPPGYLTYNVVINDPPSISILGNLNVELDCDNVNDPVSYFISDYDPSLDYTWTVTNGHVISGDESYADVMWNFGTGTVTVTATDPRTGCTSENDITVTVVNTCRSCLSFDGVDDYLVSNTTAINDMNRYHFTLEAAINGLTSEQDDYSVIISNYGTDDKGLSLLFAKNSVLGMPGNPDEYKVCVQFPYPGNIFYFFGNFNADLFLDGACHHLAVSRNVDSLFLYMDGKRVEYTVFGTDVILASNTPVHIGRSPKFGASSSFKGTISQVRVWNVERTEAEIAANMTVDIPVTADLYAYWKLNDGAGQIALEEVNNMHAQLGNSTGGDVNDPNWGVECCSVEPEKVLWFDGNDDYMICDHEALEDIATGDFTLEAEIRGDEAVQTSYPTILSNRKNFGGTKGVMMFFHPKWNGSQYKLLAVQIGAKNYFSNFNGTFNASVLDNECHHVAVTRTGNLLTFYVDGEAIGTRNLSATANNTATSTGSVYVGKDNITGTSKFEGQISNVRIWDYARTATQISENMHSDVSLETGLQAYWKMNEGSGQVAQDYTGNYAIQLGATNLADQYDPLWIYDDCGSQAPQNINKIQEVEELIDSLSMDEGVNQINLYPNPVRDVITIGVNNPTSNVTVQIFGITGMVIYEEQFGSFLRTEVDLSEQPDGIYLVKVITPEETLTTKLIKQ
ncbi:MAG: T9SS type A sorting domain-containing protein [Flavobacteriales bacterium]|nr:T9SS type A sorting domain-containing protein [Flavobacteriales bacterium]